jgi:excisionase family DNA binding protein
MQEQVANKVNDVRPIAISARELAELLNVSLRQVWRLNSAGKLPKPIRLGGSVRWNRQEVMDWFGAGCPDRQAWEATRGWPDETRKQAGHRCRSGPE